MHQEDLASNTMVKAVMADTIEIEDSPIKVKEDQFCVQFLSSGSEVLMVSFFIFSHVEY